MTWFFCFVVRSFSRNESTNSLEILNNGGKIIVYHQSTIVYYMVTSSFCWSFAFKVNLSDLLFICYEIDDMIKNIATMIWLKATVLCWPNRNDKFVMEYWRHRVLSEHCTYFISMLLKLAEESLCRRLQAFASITNEYLKFSIAFQF